MVVKFYQPNMSLRYLELEVYGTGYYKSENTISDVYSKERPAHKPSGICKGQWPQILNNFYLRPLAEISLAEILCIVRLDHPMSVLIQARHL